MIEDGEKVLFVNLEEEAWRREELNIRSRSENSEEVKGDILKEHKDFNDRVFNKAVFEKLLEWSKWDHAIELTPNATLKDCKVYLLNIKEQKELDKFLEEHLKSGQIRPSKSPCAAPFFFIKKKDGTLWPVQNYRWLNEVMIKNKYPLLLIQELINKIQGVRVANSKAGIKPTAPLSAFDKENSIEFPLDSVHYLYKLSNPNPVLFILRSPMSQLALARPLFEKKRKRKNNIQN